MTAERLQEASVVGGDTSAPSEGIGDERKDSHVPAAAPPCTKAKFVDKTILFMNGPSGFTKGGRDSDAATPAKATACQVKAPLPQQL